jgi:catalase (peroxidase I)
LQCKERKEKQAVERLRRKQDGAGGGAVPEAHDPFKRHASTMLTTDFSLRLDPVYHRSTIVFEGLRDET